MLDLLGNGTACLVWSSPLAANARRQMRYIDLMGGVKPHLLVGMVQQSRRRDAHLLRALDKVLRCRTSSRERRGSPAFPFPVQVVERVETWT